MFSVCLALAVAARGVAEEWQEGFDGGRLPVEWRVATNATAPVFRAGRAYFAEGSGGAGAIERNVRVRGSDDAPVRIHVMLGLGSGPAAAAKGAALELVWQNGSSVAVGAVRAGDERPRAWIRCRYGDAATNGVSAFRLNGVEQAGHARIVVGARAIDLAASRDGLRYRHLLTVLRGSQFPQGPARLLVGHAASEGGAHPVFVDRVAFDDGPLNLADPETFGYARGADWAESESAALALPDTSDLALHGPTVLPGGEDGVARALSNPAFWGASNLLASVPSRLSRAGGVLWDINLGAHRGAREWRHRGPSLAAGRVIVVAGPPSMLRIDGMAHPRSRIFVNGVPVSSRLDLPEPRRTPGPRPLLAALQPGTNTVVIATWDRRDEAVESERRRIRLELAPHMPRKEIALIRRLLVDFADDEVEARRAIFRQTDLLEMMGCFEEAVQVLDRYTRDFPSASDAAAAGAWHARLLRRMGRLDACADRLRRSARDAAAPGLAARFAAYAEACGAESARFDSSTTACLSAMSDVASRTYAASALRDALASEAAGDYAEAEARLRAVLRDPMCIDEAVCAALRMIGLRKACGLRDAVEESLAGLDGLLLDDPATEESYRHELALDAPSAEIDVRPPASLEAASLIQTARRAVDGGDYLRAAQFLQDVIDRYGDRLVDADGAGRRAAALFATDQLGAMPPDGLKAYRSAWDPDARRALAQAIAAGDPDAAVAAAVRYPFAGCAPEAWRWAANHYLDRDHADMTSASLGRLAQRHAVAPVTLAQWSFAAARCGDRRGAEQALNRLLDRFGGTNVTVAGRVWTVRDYARVTREHLAQSGRGALDPDAANDWRARFPAAPGDGVVGSQESPCVWRVNPYFAVVTPRSVVAQNSADLFAYDRRTGGLRWRSARPVPGLTFGPCPNVSPPEHRPVAVRGRVLARVGGRTPQSDRGAVLECWDEESGRLVWSTETAADCRRMRFVSEPALFGDRALALALEEDGATRLALVAIGIESGALLWTRQLTDDISGLTTRPNDGRVADHYGRPAVADGVCFAVTDFGTVVAVDALNGRLLWLRAYPRAGTDGLSPELLRRQAARGPSAIAVADDRVVALPRDAASLLCLRTADGQPRWARHFVDARRVAGIVDDGVRPQCVVLQGATLEGISVADGERMWSWRPSVDDGPIGGAAAVDGTNLVVFCGGGLRRLDGLRGTRLGAAAEPPAGAAKGDVNCVLAGQTVLGVRSDGLIFRPSGAPIDDGPGDPPPDEPGVWPAILSVPEAADLTMKAHVPGGHGHIAGFDDARGQVLAWVAERLLLLEPANDRVVWERPCGPGRTAAFLTARHVLEARPDRVQALRRDDGRDAWTFALQPAEPLLVAGSGGTPLSGESVVVCTTNAVHLVAESNGRILRSLAVDFEPRHVRAIPGCVLMIGPEFVRSGQSRWRAEVRDANTGERLAALPLRTERQNVVQFADDPEAGLLWAYFNGQVLSFTASGRPPSIRTFELPRHRGPIRCVAAHGEFAAVVDVPGEKREFRVETALFEAEATNAPFHAEGEWVPESASDWVGRAQNPATGWASLQCRDRGTGALRWVRHAPEPDEKEHGRAMAGGRLFRVVSRGEWTRLFERDDRAYRRATVFNPRDQGRVRSRPVNDVLPTGRRALFLEQIDMRNGGLERRIAIPGTTPDPQGPVTCRVVGERLIYGTAQGIFCLSLPAAATAAGAPESGARTRKAVTPLAEGAPGAAAAKYAATYGDRRAYVAFASGRIRTDGRVDDWRGIPDAGLAPPVFRVAERAGPDGEPPEARVRMAWDSLYLHLAAEVTDADPCGVPAGSACWFGDGLLLAIDPDGDGTDLSGELDDPPFRRACLLHVAFTTGGGWLAQYGGGSLTDPALHADDRARAFARRSPTGITYEVSIPLAGLTGGAPTAFGEGRRFGMGLVVIDRGKSGLRLLEFGSGVLDGLRPRLFHPVECVDRSKEHADRLRAVIRLEPDHPAVPDFLDRLARGAELAGASPGPVYLRLLQDSPHSRYAAFALARAFGAGPAEGSSDSLRAAARNAGVSARAIGDALGGGAAGRVLTQEVFLDSRAAPRAVAVVFQGRRDGFAHGCYWGDPRAGEHGLLRPSFVHMGPLPSIGAWHALAIPVARVALEHEAIRAVGWAALDGRAWWGATVLTSDGERRPILDRPTRPNATLSGSGEGRWVANAPSARDAHTADLLDGWRFHYWATMRPLALPGETVSDGPADRVVGDSCRRALETLAGDPLTLRFLAATERAGLTRQALIDLYRGAVWLNPDAPFVHWILLRLFALETDGTAVHEELRITLDRAVACGDPATWTPTRLYLSLSRRGRRWSSDVFGTGLNLSNHGGTVVDTNAPPDRLVLKMDIRPDPWVPGDPEARYALALGIHGNVVVGAFEGTFRGAPMSGAVSGMRDARWVTAGGEGGDVPQTVASALTGLRGLMRSAGVSREQRRLFDAAVAGSAGAWHGLSPDSG